MKMIYCMVVMIVQGPRDVAYYICPGELGENYLL